MSNVIEHYWFLERVGVQELPNYILQNSKDSITVGRRKVGNDKVIKKTVQVSRDHLVFERYGRPEDWQSVRWSVKDLGGLNGTFVNQKRLNANQAEVLNADDLIGIGCGDPESRVQADGIEIHVYRIRAPPAFTAQTVEDDDDMDTDEETPPPSLLGLTKENEAEEASSSSNIFEVEQDDACSAGPSTSTNDKSKKPLTHGDKEEQKIVEKRRHDSSDSDVEPRKKKKSRIRKLFEESSDEDSRSKEINNGLSDNGTEDMDLDRIIRNLRKRKLRVSMKLMFPPSRAVGASVRYSFLVGKGDSPILEYKVRKWRRVYPDEYKVITRGWRGLALDGSQGTPLLSYYDEWTGQRISDIEESEMEDNKECDNQQADEPIEVLLDSDDEGVLGSKEDSEDEASSVSAKKHKAKELKREEKAANVNEVKKETPRKNMPSWKRLKATIAENKQQKTTEKDNIKVGEHGEPIPTSSSEKLPTKSLTNKIVTRRGQASGNSKLTAGPYEDISSDDEISKELEIVGIHNIRKSMAETDQSSSSSSSSPIQIIQQNIPARGLSSLPQKRTRVSPDILEPQPQASVSKVTNKLDDGPPRPCLEKPATPPPLPKSPFFHLEKIKEEPQTPGPMIQLFPDSLSPILSRVKQEQGVDLKPVVSVKTEMDASFSQLEDEGDDVVIINDSDDEDKYFAMSQSIHIGSDGEEAEASSGKEEEGSGHDSDIEYLGSKLQKKDTDSETSGVEDSDDEEIFNLSQTDLFHKIKDKHNVDIKTKIKTEPLSPRLLPSKNEEESQSLLCDQEEENGTEDDELVECVLATLGPLANQALVRDAVNRSKEVGKKISYDRVFQLARTEIEAKVVENIMDKVKCGKGLVRECLAERRGSEEVFFIEKVDLEKLESEVYRVHAKNQILYQISSSNPDCDTDMFRDILKEFEDNNRPLEQKTILAEYEKKIRIIEERKKYEERARVELAAKKERDESERIKETNKFEDRTRDKAKEDRTRDKAKEDRTRYKGKEDKSETRTISTEHKFDDDMMLSPISDVQEREDHSDVLPSDDDFEDQIKLMNEDQASAVELASTDAAKKNQTIVDTPATEAVRKEQIVSEETGASPIDDIDELLRDDDDEDATGENEDKTNEKETVPIKQKSKLSRSIPSGSIKYTEALPQPSRRAFNRGISEQTIAALKARDTLPGCKPRPEPASKKGGTLQEYVKIPRVVDRPKTQAEKMSERRAKLAEVAARTRTLPTNVQKSSVVQAGVMKSSMPKNKRLLEEIQEPIRPVDRRARDKHPSGDTAQRVEKKEIFKPAVAAASILRRRNTNPEQASSSTSSTRTRRISESSGFFDKEKNRSQAAVCGGNSSGGFLESEAMTERKASRKEKMKRTGEGYVMNKLSVDNMDYSVGSQDPTNNPIQKRFLHYSGVTKTVRDDSTRKKKNVKWADQAANGLLPLVEVKEIEADNKGKKIGKVGDIMAEVPKRMKAISTDDVLEQMVCWSHHWLKEQNNPKLSDAPPVNGPYNVQHLPGTFKDYEEYRRLFMPLFLHELWSSITREIEEKEARGGEMSLPVMIQERKLEKKFQTFHCCCVLTESENRGEPGQNGMFVSIALSSYVDSNRRSREIRPVFGYIEEAQKTVIDHYKFSERDQDHRDLLLKNKKNKNVRYWVRYVIRTKVDKKQKLLCLERPIIVKFLARVKPELRKVQAMMDLPKSQLFTSIVNPNVKTLVVRCTTDSLHPNIKDLTQFKKLNEMQRRIIVGVSRSCLEPDQKICLIQGPPGTGKSSTIVGIILQIISARLSGCQGDDRKQVPRILVCAPSNAAVDELALKLIDLRESLPDSKQFNLVRMGLTKHAKTQSISYDSLVKRMVTTDTRQIKSASSLEQDERSKQAQANKIYAEKEAAEKLGNTDLALKLEREYKEVMKEKGKIKSSLNRPLDRRQAQDIEKNATHRLMMDVDVILSTLSSSTNLTMENFFVKRSTMRQGSEKFRDISVCIIDEASQCVEPEALMPLKLKFNKLVMVGDHEQLPATVISKKAKYFGYHKSLFGRLYHLFSTGLTADEEKKKKDPILRLNTQYRMHDEICHWPNRYFYGGLLTTGGQKRGSVLAPYTVFNYNSPMNTEKGAESNDGECKLTVEVAQAVRHLAKHLSIGVITFYAKQKTNIIQEIQSRRISDIDVNTVDGYQGSERDVIIISCVRSGGGSIGFLSAKERLNVALTRAKSALVLIGDLNTLQCDPMWKELVENARERGVIYDTSAGNSALHKILATSRKSASHYKNLSNS